MTNCPVLELLQEPLVFDFYHFESKKLHYMNGIKFLGVHEKVFDKPWFLLYFAYEESRDCEDF